MESHAIRPRRITTTSAHLTSISRERIMIFLRFKLQSSVFLLVTRADTSESKNTPDFHPNLESSFTTNWNLNSQSPRIWSQRRELKTGMILINISPFVFQLLVASKLTYYCDIFFLSLFFFRIFPLLFSLSFIPCLHCCVPLVF